MLRSPKSTAGDRLHESDAEELAAIGEAICETCRSLHRRNLLAAADGNVSVRLPNGRVLITPAGVNKMRMRSKDLVVLTETGEFSTGRPSTERHLHLTIYDQCPTARAVVHAHPPTAIAWSIAQPERTELPADVLPEVILGVGAIPIVPYALPGTPALGQGLQRFLPAHRVLVLQRHGAVSWGESLDEAYDGMERAEHVAQILKSAFELGGLTPLGPQEIAALTDARRRLGPRTL
jgi:L-fuculose-phosphate aldolase